eukprot:3940638-Rhodomonas_salina.3
MQIYPAPTLDMDQVGHLLSLFVLGVRYQQSGAWYQSGAEPEPVFDIKEALQNPVTEGDNIDMFETIRDRGSPPQPL